MNISKTPLLLFLVGFFAATAMSQDDQINPLDEFDSPFRSAPSDETDEQRALAVLADQKRQILYLESQLEAQQRANQVSMEMNKRTTTILSRSLVQLLQKETGKQEFAIQQIAEFLELTSQNAHNRPSPIWLDGALEYEIQNCLASQKLKAKTIDLLNRHLTTKGIMLGYQPPGTYWRPIGEVIEVETGITRSKLAEPQEFYFDEFSLEEVLDELSMMSDVDFNFELTPERLEREVTYIQNDRETADALQAILSAQGLGYRISGKGIDIYSQQDSRLRTRDIFFVAGLLTEEVNLEKLLELIKVETDGANESQPEFSVIDKNSFAVIGTEPQLRTVSKLLGGFRAANSDSGVNSQGKNQKLHPAATLANRAIKAIQAKDIPELTSLIQGQDEDDKERMAEFIDDVQSWFQGINEVSELRSRGETIVAKIRETGGEVIVITLEEAGGRFWIQDINSPSVDDYNELDVLPLNQSK